MKKIFKLLLGVLLVSLGLFFLLLYLNLFTFGYTFLEYVHFISRRIECYSMVVGIILLFSELRTG